MYDYIKGILTNKNNSQNNNTVTIETSSGIGFLINITQRDYYKLNTTNEPIKLYTVLIHKEDKMSLCGFIRREDRDIFNILISVSGVGSKMALTLINEFSSTELIGLVIQGNFKELTRAKGVGAKLAQKIILELKGKLMNYQGNEPLNITLAQPQNSQNIEDATTVLNSLGYDKNEIKTALSKSLANLKENASAEEILTETLKVLSV